MLCLGAKIRDSKCVSQAGIDAAAYQACKSNPAEVKRIQDAVNAAGKGVTSFPKVTINGEDKSVGRAGAGRGGQGPPRLRSSAQGVVLPLRSPAAAQS